MKLQGKEIKNALNNSFTFTVLVEQSRALKSVRKTGIWEIISSFASKAKITGFSKVVFFFKWKAKSNVQNGYFNQIHIIVHTTICYFPSFLEHIYLCEL